MDRRSFVKATGVAGAALAMGGVVSATPGRDPGPKENEVLVGISAGAGDVRGAVEEDVPDGADVVHVNEGLRYVAVAFPEDAPERAREQFMAAITEKRHVKYAEKNATHTALLTPNDPKFDQQYAPDMVNAPAAWDTTLGSSSITVGVVDQGVQYTHDDLDDNMDGSESNYGQDFVDDDEDPYPDDLTDEYHGTHVAGIAAAETDNGTGVAGISESSILSARALSEEGSGSTSDIADAIEWAADQGVDVINLSLGGGGYTDTMKNAVSYAYDNGVFIAAAAGNDGQASVSYPAAYSECLAVSALDSDGSLASYSNYGSEIELAAPGTNVLSTTTTDRGSYEELSGTSMATPVVSGCAGLALDQWDLTNAEVRSHLKDTAVDVGLPSDQQGSGRVDADNAVSTDPGSGDGGGGGDSTTTSVSDSLSGYWDYDCWSYGWEYSTTSTVVVELDGPSDADFDLYVNTGDTACPGPNDYDYASYSTDSQETVSISDPDTSTDLQISVDSYSGSGSYTLTITEYLG
jgi:serine protease